MGLKKTFGRWFGFGKQDEENQEIIQEVEETSEELQEEIIEEISEEASEADLPEAEEITVDEIPPELVQAREVSQEAEIPQEPQETELEVEEVQSGEEIAQITESCESEEESVSLEDAVPAEETEVAMESEEDSVSEEKIIEKPKQKMGFFARLKSGLEKTRKSFNDKIDSVLKMFHSVDEDLFEELEEALIMADVGVETSLYIIGQLRDRVKSDRIKEPSEVKGAIEEIIAEILSENDTSMKLETTPSVIMVIGVNGVGKTTSIGKMAARYKAEGKKVVLGAADTFRAAAIDQLQIWADRSGIDLIKHQEGSDPAAVVFDTISAAKARGADVIILDTAGRLHNKKNLMDELSKIFRVMDRELPGCSKETLLVLDATTGQNAVNQVKLFRESADITGIILTKLDGSAKGGIVLAIAHEEKIPVKLVGVGEGIEDLQVFDADDFAKALFMNE